MWSTAAHCAAVDSPDCLYVWEMKEGKPSNGFPSISILRKEMLRITKKQPSLLSDWLYCSPTEWDSGQWSEPGVGVNFSLNGRPLSCCFWGVWLQIWDGFFAG